MTPDPSDLLALHDAAVAEGRTHYIDPHTTLLVFTELGLALRGDCCGAGCRHCPYGHRSVAAPDTRAAGVPTWRRCTSRGERDVLFWSGGKDSFLAYCALEEEGERPLVLLTTHDGRTGTIAHQEVHVDQVIEQARRLGLDLITVPLSPQVDYLDAVSRALSVIEREGPVVRLVFGDLHLEEIRSWRERSFSDRRLHFPLWKVPVSELLKRFEASGATATLSAASSGAGQVGDRFDRAFVAGLPEGIDPFGENGEFHTLVQPRSG